MTRHSPLSVAGILGVLSTVLCSLVAPPGFLAIAVAHRSIRSTDARRTMKEHTRASQMLPEDG